MVPLRDYGGVSRLVPVNNVAQCRAILCWMVEAVLPWPNVRSELLDAFASLTLAAFGRGDCVPKSLFWMGDRARFAA